MTLEQILKETEFLLGHGLITRREALRRLRYTDAEIDKMWAEERAEELASEIENDPRVKEIITERMVKIIGDANAPVRTCKCGDPGDCNHCGK